MRKRTVTGAVAGVLLVFIATPSLVGSQPPTRPAPPPESGFRTFDIPLASAVPVALATTDTTPTDPPSPAATVTPVPTDPLLRTARPTPTPTPKPTPEPQPRGQMSGWATWYDHGTTAMRLPRGTLVKICGGGGCITRTITDYGPAEWTGRIADLMPADFRAVCGCSTSAGVTWVTAYLL